MNSDELNPYAAPQSVTVPPIALSSAEAPSAGQGKRFLNYLIDWMAMVGVFAVIGVVLAILDEAGVTYRAVTAFEDMDSIPNFLFGSVVTLGYYTFFEGLFARSLGKWITGTKVVTASGTPLTFVDALLRSVSRLVPFEAFSFLGGGIDTGWHDKWTSTRVVDLRAKPVIKPRPMSAGSMPRMYKPPMPVSSQVPPPSPQ